MEYGLRASLLNISESFYNLLAERKINGDAIYTRIAFITSAGKLLVDSHLSGAKQEPGRDWKTFLTLRNLGVAKKYMTSGVKCRLIASWIEVLG